MCFPPEWLPRGPILKSQETPPIEHTEDQPLPSDSNSLFQRPKRVLYELQGRDDDHQIDALIRKGERLRIASEARWALEAAGFQ